MRNRRRRSFGPESGGGSRRGGGGGRGRRGKSRGGRHGGKRGRARRGEVRYILLDMLRDGPKHGYEIIKALEERSAGEYVPSPGTVYPTLQFLEDQGFIVANEETERRSYQLTKEGEAELDAQAELIAAFWSRFEQQDTNAAQPEIGFLEDELEHLNRIVWSGLRDAIAQGDQELIRDVRQAVETCQSEVREAIKTKRS